HHLGAGPAGRHGGAPAPVPAGGAMKLRVPWSARLLISGAVLAVLLAFVPVAQLWDGVRAVPPALWLAALAGYLAGHLVASVKWWSLLSPDAAVTFGQAVRSHFTGQIANLCLLGVAGGDVVRAACLMSES